MSDNRHKEALGTAEPIIEVYEPCDSYKFYKVESLDFGNTLWSKDYSGGAEARCAYEALARSVPTIYKYVILRNRNGSIIDVAGNKD